MVDGRDPRVDKHDQLLEKLVEQQIRFEEMMKVQIRRVDAAEEAQKKKADIDIQKEIELTKQLATMGQSMNMIKWAAAIIGGSLLLNIVQQFIIK